jgi:hypothetical protein
MTGSADNAARPSMKRSSILIAAVAVAAVIGGGVAYVMGVADARKPNAEMAMGPPMAGAANSSERALPMEAAGSTADQGRQLALAIEQALVARDPQQRETAFNILLPELIRVAPGRVADIVARREPGEMRDTVRDEVSRQWITMNRDQAVGWIGSLEERERRAAATIAMRTLAARDPAEAIEVADQFGVGRDDGSLEHIVQIWATENPDEAMRWIAKQPPDDPRTAPLRERIDRVRAQQTNSSP